MLETLGILIGFVTVVLLLSVVSTSLVQMTSSVLRLRGRNMFRGLEMLFVGAAATCGKKVNMSAKSLVEAVCSSPRLLARCNALANIGRCCVANS